MENSLKRTPVGYRLSFNFPFRSRGSPLIFFVLLGVVWAVFWVELSWNSPVFSLFFSSILLDEVSIFMSYFHYSLLFRSDPTTPPVVINHGSRNVHLCLPNGFENRMTTEMNCESNENFMNYVRIPLLTLVNSEGFHCWRFPGRWYPIKIDIWFGKLLLFERYCRTLFQDEKRVKRFSLIEYLVITALTRVNLDGDQDVVLDFEPAHLTLPSNTRWVLISVYFKKPTWPCVSFDKLEMIVVCRSGSWCLLES